MFEEVYLQNIGLKFGPVGSTEKYTEIPMKIASHRPYFKMGIIHEMISISSQDPSNFVPPANEDWFPSPDP